jgi:hypothetical protein
MLIYMRCQSLRKITLNAYQREVMITINEYSSLFSGGQYNVEECLCLKINLLKTAYNSVNSFIT